VIHSSQTVELTLCGIAIKEFGIRRDCNATAENWNKIVKL